MITDDIQLTRYLLSLAEAHPLLEAHTCNLSICTFRYVPAALAGATGTHRDYLNKLNQALAHELQRSGKAFLSNAVINDNYLLRACIVNFRTTKVVMEQVAKLVVEIGQRLDTRLRS